VIQSAFKNNNYVETRFKILPADEHFDSGSDVHGS